MTGSDADDDAPLIGLLSCPRRKAGTTVACDEDGGEGDSLSRLTASSPGLEVSRGRKRRRIFQGELPEVVAGSSEESRDLQESEESEASGAESCDSDGDGDRSYGRSSRRSINRASVGVGPGIKKKGRPKKSSKAKKQKRRNKNSDGSRYGTIADRTCPHCKRLYSSVHGLAYHISKCWRCKRLSSAYELDLSSLLSTRPFHVTFI